MNDTGRAQDQTSGAPGPEPAFPAQEGGPLGRSDQGRMLTGVCAGLGRYAGVDPVLVRVGFAVLVLGSGIGIILYIAAFLLMRETDGGPGHLEQWTRRDFDGETVLTLLTGVFALGLVINVSSDGVGTGTIVVGTVFAIALMAAHARGIDLLAVARSLPDRLRRRDRPHPDGSWRPSPAPPMPPMPPVPPTSPFPSTSFPPAPSAPYTVADPAGDAVPLASEDAARPLAHAGPDGETITEPPGPGSPDGSPRPDGFGSGPARPYADAGHAPPPPYRTASPSFDSSGEPFSPYGPYQPLDPRRRERLHSPYAPSGYGGPVEAPPAPRRPRSFVGAVTIILAMIVGGITVAIQSTSGSVDMTITGGAALAVIGAGLLVTAWFGRGAGLVVIGTVLALALVGGSLLAGMPKKFGDYHWEPAALSEVADGYEVGVGEGVLDLSELALPPGSRTVLDASVTVGEISVILPATARAEVNGSTRFGDVKIDHTVEGGADIRYSKVLEPEVPPKGDVATIVLNVKAGIGDVEVRRAA